jgi:hypothetical protein
MSAGPGRSTLAHQVSGSRHARAAIDTHRGAASHGAA